MIVIVNKKQGLRKSSPIFVQFYFFSFIGLPQQSLGLSEVAPHASQTYFFDLLPQHPIKITPCLVCS
jgi:hypothetical protein